MAAVNARLSIPFLGPAIFIFLSNFGVTVLSHGMEAGLYQDHPSPARAGPGRAGPTRARAGLWPGPGPAPGSIDLRFGVGYRALCWNLLKRTWCINF